MKQKTVLGHLKRVERKVYPSRYRHMQHVETWDSLAEYCEGKPHVETWNGGYALWTPREIVDIASTTRLSLAHMRYILRRMANTCGTKKVVEMDCRATTSYRLVRSAERLDYLVVIGSTPYDWDGETFYGMEVEFTDKAL